MSPDDIKQLRKDLKATARELAAALEIDQKEVVAWEVGDRFPTKRYVAAMQKLKVQGPSAIPRARGKASAKTGNQRLADPKMWEIVRKLVEHPAFFDQVAELAGNYADPEVDGKKG